MDLLGRHIDIFRNAAKSKADGTSADDQLAYEAMCYCYQRIDAHPYGAEAKRTLLRDDSGWVRSWVAAQLLAERSPAHSAEAKKVLQVLVGEPGVLGISAEIVLTQYAKGK